MRYYVYILQSEQDGTFYIGYSSNLESRLEKHNSSKTGYTSKKKPWRLVYKEFFDKKTDAIKREKFLKSQRNRAFYQKLIDG
jgi:putative endonuclease